MNKSPTPTKSAQDYYNAVLMAERTYTPHDASDRPTPTIKMWQYSEDEPVYVSYPATRNGHWHTNPDPQQRLSYNASSTGEYDADIAIESVKQAHPEMNIISRRPNCQWEWTNFIQE